MKSKTQLLHYLVFCFAVVTFSVHAQTINVSQTAGINGMSVCNTDQQNIFNLQLEGYPVNTVLHLSFSTGALTGNCTSNPFNVVVTSGNPAVYNSIDDRFEIPLNGTSSNITYRLDIDCSLLSLSNPQNPQPVTVTQSYSGDLVTTWSVSGLSGQCTGSACTLSAQVFSIINASSINTSYPTFFGSSETLTFDYVNPSSISANVGIRWQPGIFPECGRYEIVSAQLEYTNSSGNLIVVPNYIPGTYVSIDLGSNEHLIITIDVNIIGCEEDCPATITTFLDYVCDRYVNDPLHCSDQMYCNRTQQNFSLSDDLTHVKSVSFSRVSPLNVWETENGLCMQGDLPWQYRIQNTGTVMVDHININLSNYVAGADLTKIDPASVTVTCATCSIGTPTIVNCTSASCEACGTNSLESYAVQVFNLDINEQVLVNFTSNLCCYNDISLLNEAKFINQWRLVVNAFDECGEEITRNNAAAPNNPWFGLHQGISNNQRENGLGGAPPDVVQQLEFFPTVTDLLGSFNEVGDFNVDLRGIFNARGDYSLVFPHDTSITDTSNIPGGILRVVIDSDRGLAVLNCNNPGQALRIFDPTNPSIEIFPLQDCYSCTTVPDVQVSDCTEDINRQEFYFDLHASIETLIQNGVSNDPVFLFQRLFRHGRLGFSMESSCPACQPQAHFDVNFFLEPKIWDTGTEENCGGYTCSGGNPIGGNDFCWIPLSSVHWQVFIHCVGCVTPGIISERSSIWRTTYGFEDADDNGSVDTPIPDGIDANYSQFLNMRHISSIMGDTIVDTLFANFTNGSPPGWTYNTMCSTYNACLNNLYLEKLFENSNSTAFDLQWFEVDVRILDGGGNLIGSIGYQAPDPVHVEHVGDWFRLKVDKADIVPAGFEFAPGQHFEVIFKYRVCGNLVPTPGSPVADYRYLSLLANRMYLMGADHPFVDLDLFADADQSQLQDLIDNGQAYANTTKFICEGCGGVHNFYSVSTYNATGDYFSYDCAPRSEPSAGVLIGGGAFNVFPFEFRRPPIELTNYHINVPVGFNISTVSPPWTFTQYRAYNNGTFSNVNSGSCLFPQLPNATQFDFSNINYYPIGATVPSGCALPFGDETFRQYFDVVYVPECEPDPVELTVNTGIATFQHEDCNGNDVSETVPWPYPLSDPYPNPTVTITYLPTSHQVDVNTPTVCWNVQINSTGASNLYMYINSALGLPFLNNWSIESESPCGSGQITPVSQTANVFELADFLDEVGCFRICADLTGCPVGELEVPLFWGYQCDGYPTPLTFQNTCFSDTDTVAITIADWNVETNSYGVFNSSATAVTEYDLCDPFYIETCFESLQAGTVTLDGTVSFDVTFPVPLPAGVTVLNCELVNPSCGTCAPLVVTLQPVGSGFQGTVAINDLANDLHYGLNDPLAPGYLHFGDDLCLRLYFEVNCIIADPIPLPDVEMHFISFCDADFDQIATPPFQNIDYSGISACPINCNDLSFAYTIDGSDLCLYEFSTTTLPCSSATSITWDFGDGGVGSGYNVQHTFQTDGTYQVCVTTECCDGEECVYCEEVIVEGCLDTCYADIDIMYNLDPLTCETQFTSIYNGTGVIVDYYWIFGDDWSTSTDPDPVHQYAGSGTYTVDLFVMAITGDDTCYGHICDTVIISCGDSCYINLDWSYSVDSENCTVQFTDESTIATNAQIIQWIWDFGDGTYSYDQNPVHTYPGSGAYPFTLFIMATNGSGTDTCFMFACCDTLYLNCCDITPSFTYAVSADPKCKLIFTNTSVTDPACITEYYWDFGDGNTSTDENPVNSFPHNGWFYVCLTVTEICNQDTCIETYCDSVYVVHCGCDLGIAWNYIPDSTGCSYTFTSTFDSSCVTSCFWTFGDGSTSTDCNAIHTYQNSGSYDVCLYVTQDCDSVICVDSLCMTIEVNCADTCELVTSYNAFPDSLDCLTYQFTSTSTGIGSGCAVSYLWNFDDLTQDNVPNPIHTFPGPGQYYVCLMVTTICDGDTCTDRSCDSIYVECDSCTIEAEWTYAIGHDRCEINFINQSVASSDCILSCAWNFGDGTISTDCNPSHLYQYNGTYKVCLEVTAECNGVICKDKICHDIVVENCNDSIDCCLRPEMDIAQNAQDRCKYKLSDKSSTCDTLAIIGYMWTIDGVFAGTSSTITHVFSGTGWHYICLTVFSVSVFDPTITCTETICDSVYTENCKGCEAKPEFSFESNECKVIFTNLSTIPSGYTLVAYLWDFDDGTTGTSVNPVHVYNASGTYHVCLTMIITNGTITCTEKICHDVSVDHCVRSECTVDADMTFINNQCKVEFFDLSTGGSNSTIVSWKWDFGDGTNSNQQNPVHTFNSSGGYTVCLEVTAFNGVDYCSDLICLTVEVWDCHQEDCAVTADFTQLTNECTVHFFDLTATGANTSITNWYWDFGDGNSISSQLLQNVTHTFATTGIYKVCLTADGDNGSTHCNNTICYDVGVLCDQARPESSNYSVIPNPSNGSFIVTVISEKEEKADIIIYDELGSVLKKDEVSILGGLNQYAYDFSRYEEGIYFVKINRQSESAVLKLILVK